MGNSDARLLRRKFARELVRGLRVTWPILSGLLAAIILFGVLIGSIEGWTLEEAIYFSSVTWMTIGYGDFVPGTLLTRMLSFLIGICGLLLAAILAAIAVKALQTALEDRDGR